MTHLIDNQWLTGNGPTFNSLNPANNDILWQGQGADSQQIDDAVTAARAAFPAWSLASYTDRLAMVKAFQTQLKEHAKEIAI